MSMIENANGKSVSVNSEGALFVRSDIRGSKLQEILRGWGFVVVVPTVTPTGAGDYFLMIQNDSSDVMVIDHIELTDAGAEEIYAEVGAAYTVGGTHATAFTAQNQLVGSTNVYSTKATIEAGVDITGITAADNEVLRFENAAGVVTALDLSARPIVLGQGQQISFAAVTGTAAITSVKVSYYHIMTPNTNY